MSILSDTYHALACEGEHETIEGEPVFFIDLDTERRILSRDIDDLRSWARGDGWITYRGQDRCGDCRVLLMVGPHDFLPGLVVPEFCAICDEWATEGQHPTEVPGQLELPAPSGAERTTP